VKKIEKQPVCSRALISISCRITADGIPCNGGIIYSGNRLLVSHKQRLFSCDGGTFLECKLPPQFLSKDIRNFGRSAFRRDAFAAQIRSYRLSMFLREKFSNLSL
jgi:hypothetical protein